MSRDKLVDVGTTLMHASVNVGCQGKSGLGKIYEVILVLKGILSRLNANCCVNLQQIFGFFIIQ